MPPRLFSLLLLACSWPLATGRTATRELDRSRQCVVVLTDNWASTTGVMHSFERDEAVASWKEQGPGIAVVAGKNGLGQGRGLVRLDFAGAPAKKEGDDRSARGDLSSFVGLWLRPGAFRRLGQGCLIWRCRSRSKASTIRTHVFTTSWWTGRRSRRSIGAAPSRCAGMISAINGAWSSTITPLRFRARDPAYFCTSGRVRPRSRPAAPQCRRALW